jgi:LacI family transcriptional regulator
MLSEHVGLTDGTVSRALNDYPDIAEKTRERVKAAARELGYQPNHNARRLATGAAECVAYVMPARTSHASDPFLAELLNGLSRAMLKRGWDLTITAAGSIDDEIQQIKRLAAANRVNGFVVSRTLADDPRIDTLLELGVPFISHGRTRNANDYAWFDVDNRAAFRTAFEHLYELGHRKIGFIGGPAEYNFAQKRHAGYLDGLRAAGLPVQNQWLVESPLTLDGGETAMTALLDSAQPPTAVLCVTDMVAIGAMAALRKRALRAGRDIAIVGYDGIAVGDYTSPTLTTMTQPLIEAGETLGSMLLNVVDGDDPRAHQVLVDARLVQRESSTGVAP